jgi:hypothetical protein
VTARDRRRLVRLRIWIVALSLDIVALGLLLLGLSWVTSRILS